MHRSFSILLRTVMKLPVALAAFAPLLLSLTLASFTLHAAAQSPEPAMQLAPDQAAFNAANAKLDSLERVAALETFLHDFPKSKRADRARRIQLELLIAQRPRDDRRIHTAAQALIDSAGKDGRATQENVTAYILAEAPPHGVDLASAEAWARDSVQQLTLPAFTEQMKDMFADKKDAKLSQAEREKVVRPIWATLRASTLQTLAEVYFQEGKVTEATAALDEAQALSPTLGAIFATRGEIAHAQHQDDRALEALENAELYGGITPATHDLSVALYAAQHGGSSSGLEAEIDHRYAALFKPAPAVPHAAATSGRTILLQLFTGSGCEPCAAADLATDAVLRNYPRTEVVVLAFDQHIPEPDPLANPATIARAAYDGVQFTPTFRLNGAEGPLAYGERSNEAKAYQILASAIDKALATPSGASLRLAAHLTPAHLVTASAEVTVTNGAALGKLLSDNPAAKSTSLDTKAVAPPPADKSAAASTADKAAAAPRLVLNFALVQPEVRYSGENGIRFHSMVVRALAKPTASEGFPVAPSGGSGATASFDPAAISASLSRYLADFARHNERFAAPHFLSTDTTLPLNDLAVAAWVEDLTTHQVVAAAYTPLDGVATQQAAR